MVETVAQGECGVLAHGWAIHWLQVEALEVKIFEEVRHGAFLWEDQLQFVAVAQDERRSSLGADADPVEALWRVLRAVRLDRHLEPRRVQGIHEVLVELQERFATRTDNQGASPGRRRRRPLVRDRR